MESPFDQFGAADIDGPLDVQIVVLEETAAVDNQHLCDEREKTRNRRAVTMMDRQTLGSFLMLCEEKTVTLSKRLLRITEASWWGSTTATAFSLLAIKDADSFFFFFLPYVSSRFFLRSVSANGSPNLEICLLLLLLAGQTHET